MYCTLDDLKKVLPEENLIQLTDDESLGSIKEERIAEAIAQADGEIDSFIGGRYTVPLTSVPAVIRRCSTSIATYHLYKRRVEDIPDSRRGDYKDAIDILKSIREGNMNITELSGSSDCVFDVLVSSHFEETTNA